MSIESKVDKNKCFGCSACFNICPTKAIVMRNDEEGFLSPFVDKHACVECKKCEQICPAGTPNINKKKICYADTYIVQSKAKERKRSASGGVFYTIANEIIKDGGIVCGAAFNEENVVYHKFAENPDQLRNLQNSKYVQSNIGTTFSIVKQYLSDGRVVFFSGTPCQVAGLLSYLNKQYCNLLTADLICHGVPSPKLLKRQIDEESKTWQGSVKRISFRYKNALFKSSSSFYMMMMMMHGLPIVRRPKDDPFFNIFSNGYGFRESCYSCPFASPDRVGDITLGDCDSHRLYPDFHPAESNSTVILNTDKAKRLWSEKIEKLCDSQVLDIENEIKYNKQLGKPSERPKQRNDVYNDLEKMSWNEFSGKYAGRQTRIGKIRSYFSLIMPPFVVKMWSRMHE